MARCRDLVGATRGGELRVDGDRGGVGTRKEVPPADTVEPNTRGAHAVDRLDHAARERVDPVDALLEQLIAALDQALQLATTEVDGGGVQARGERIRDQTEVGRD